MVTLLEPSIVNFGGPVRFDGLTIDIPHQLAVGETLPTVPAEGITGELTSHSLCTVCINLFASVPSFIPFINSIFSRVLNISLAFSIFPASSMAFVSFANAFLSSLSSIDVLFFALFTAVFRDS